MRLGITIVRAKGASEFTVLRGPEIPLPDQIAAFRYIESGEEEIEEAQLWTSSRGCERRKVFAAHSGINLEAIKPPSGQVDEAPVDDVQAPVDDVQASVDELGQKKTGKKK